MTTANGHPTPPESPELERRLALTTLIARLATEFIGLESDRIDAAIAETLGELSRFSRMERAGIALYDDAGESWRLAHEWHEPGLAPLAPLLTKVPVTYREAYERLHNGESVAYGGHERIRAEAPSSARLLADLGIGSIVTLPILPEPGHLMGFVAFGTAASELPHEADLRLGADLVAGFLVHTLERKISDRALATSERRMLALESSGALGVFLADSEDRVVRANEALDPAGVHAHHHHRWQDLISSQGTPIAEIERTLAATGVCRAFEARFGAEPETSTAYMVTLARIEGGEEPETLGLLVDLTERKAAEAKLAFRYGFDRLVTRLAARFVRGEPDQLQLTMEHALAETAEFFGVDRCSLCMANEERDALEVTASWSRQGATEGVSPAPPIVRDRFPDMFERIFDRAELVVVDNDDDATFDAHMQHLLSLRRVRTALLLPVLVGGDVIGFLGLISVNERMT
jgi:hypothetical protein